MENCYQYLYLSDSVLHIAQYEGSTCVATPCCGGLTSPRQVDPPVLRVCLEGGQQPRFRTHRRGVGTGERGQMTSRVSIFLDPSSISAAAGSVHFEPSQINQPHRRRAFCLASVARRRHAFGYCRPGNGDGWACRKLICGSGEFTFRHGRELSSNRLVRLEMSGSAFGFWSRRGELQIWHSSVQRRSSAAH